VGKILGIFPEDFILFNNLLLLEISVVPASISAIIFVIKGCELQEKVLVDDINNY